ncbi:bifunctional 5,10-methylenetetrahydrofolate dehydrogenase/5,10-methenyltetrahydrofolate cyclohydrolase [Mycoplasmopsis caviae]|uniref:Bifunctional protein FolD n=1 Tax=Mycoplasmopsis caviae TaxID=55603 RepID=A0A3P8L7E0_9BACT|nr:bifunctional 5,10-methylenetetrahydrofolate dehydrogenase/5,10-methenyltetrahydrofolate cyclohydrolase [Mycoplasmopsis caviae]UUD35049.1 bifunctional 5,10-methylenetetrahydrofolate dehydrogenase/5,10-methenyltetrahydrofolate cyclohydrolase [Mycoplasmopsis caviae]VDR42125.1 methylenetetrahydrofolate dehydrogenase (NADP+), methenyltetrahydrofolate cyclohydrolase [Mycoplasmopsis caviae]
MKILDGKSLAKKRTEELIVQFKDIREKLGRKPILSIIQVGDNPASTQYIKNKMKKAEELGVEAIHHHFPADIRQKDLLKKLDVINEKADGIIIQLPLPKESATQVILDSVRIEKDIDGLCTRNAFNFYNQTDDFTLVPATALGILDLLHSYKVELYEKRVAVIGRSILVGKPTAFLLKQEGCNVSTYNRNTGIKGVESADIVVVAAGEAKLLKKANVKEGAVVIDVGANWVEEDGQKVLYGDVDIETMPNHLSAFAPVPGGVGPMTIVSLFSNLAKSIIHVHRL